MKLKTLVALPAVLLGTSYLSPAGAQPTSHTVFSYYEVSGRSLSEVHRDMMKKGPRAGSAVGYGLTTVQTGKGMTVAACESRGRYEFDAQFVIRLPRIAPSAQLSAADRRQFANFVNFVKNHEETHRSIWMKYIAKVDRELSMPGKSNCVDAHSRAMKLWQDMLSGYRSLHIAFDKQQRGPLRSNPFIKSASR